MNRGYPAGERKQHYTLITAQDLGKIGITKESMLTIDALGEAAGVPVRTLRSWVYRDYIRAFRVVGDGNRTLFFLSAVNVARKLARYNPRYIDSIRATVASTGNVTITESIGDDGSYIVRIIPPTRLGEIGEWMDKMRVKSGGKMLDGAQAMQGKQRGW